MHRLEIENVLVNVNVLFNFIHLCRYCKYTCLNTGLWIRMDFNRIRIRPSRKPDPYLGPTLEKPDPNLDPTFEKKNRYVSEIRARFGSGSDYDPRKATEPTLF